MKIQCVWEHNGGDSILYSANFVGAFTRGKSKDEAARKMPSEILSYLAWKGDAPPDALEPEIVQEKASALTVSDADSDVLFNGEKAPLTAAEYEALKSLAMKSARDFLALYRSIPDKDKSALPPRATFYGEIPRTAREMYKHTKNVNAYYFGEIGGFSGESGFSRKLRRGMVAAKGVAQIHLARQDSRQGNVPDGAENLRNRRCAEHILLSGQMKRAMPLNLRSRRACISAT